jgi:alkanesulfonate monooxygenase SsuD/methylene tetrahydromethanopterin reductase-like flavin-dependent oxidoreductase (luciferase family)
MRVASLELGGTPETIADKMEDAMDQVGGDGFLVLAQPTSRDYIREITEGLCPALQRRGLLRKSFSHKHFRDNLRSF